MFNLLSKKEINVLKWEYFFRLASIFFFLFAAVVLIFSVLLLPTYFNLSIRAEQIKDAINEAKHPTIKSEGYVIESQAVLLKQKLDALKLIDEKTPAKLLSGITESKNSGVSITLMRYKKASQKDFFEITLGGVAKDRNSLLKFKETLEKRGDFVSVDLPVASFVSSEDINFSMTLKCKK